MEYKILKVHSDVYDWALRDLEKLVNEFIEKGYIPVGGFYLKKYDNCTVAMQAVLSLD